MSENYIARPWHLMNQDKYPRVSEEIADSRLAFCHDCPSLIAGTCKECGCFMSQKVKLEFASCPLGKW